MFYAHSKDIDEMHSFQMSDMMIHKTQAYCQYEDDPEGDTDTVIGENELEFEKLCQEVNPGFKLQRIGGAVLNL